eukprot:GILK01011330.1.p1 GENE.GILK01011330.1~~GILK01011330.1.p1  ORF type:complete len:542 (-),score=85.12 GILK01011330.1:234-1802(-)
MATYSLLHSPRRMKTANMGGKESEENESTASKIKETVINGIQKAGDTIDKKFQPGSMKGSIFTLVSATIGAGILSLPYTLARSGLVLGILLLVFGGFVAFFSAYLLVKCSQITDLDGFTAIMDRTFGLKWKMFTEVCMILNLFGALVAFMVVIGTMCSVALTALFGESFWTDRYLVTVITVMAFAFPLSLKRDINAFRYTSLLGFFCLVYLALIISIEYFEGVDTADAADSEIVLVDFSWSRLFETIPLIVFAYSCHPNVLPIFAELNHPTTRRMTKVLDRSLIGSFVIYFVVAVFGFLTFKAATNPNILLNDYNNSIAVHISRFALALTLLCAIPLTVYPARESLNGFFMDARTKIKGQGSQASSLPMQRSDSPIKTTVVSFSTGDMDADNGGFNPSQIPTRPYGYHAMRPVETDSNEDENSTENSTETMGNLRFISLTLVLLVGSLLLALTVSNIDDVLGFLGATTNPIICYLLPCAMFLKLDPSPNLSMRKIPVYMTLVGMSSIGLLCLAEYFRSHIVG